MTHKKYNMNLRGWGKWFLKLQVFTRTHWYFFLWRKTIENVHSVSKSTRIRGYNYQKKLHII